MNNLFFLIRFHKFEIIIFHDLAYYGIVIEGFLLRILWSNQSGDHPEESMETCNEHLTCSRLFPEELCYSCYPWWPWEQTTWWSFWGCMKIGKAQGGDVDSFSTWQNQLQKCSTAAFMITIKKCTINKCIRRRKGNTGFILEKNLKCLETMDRLSICREQED
jgi:hypothetical protein